MGQKIIEGSLDAKGFKFAIVVGRFNSFVTDHLLEGALDGLKRHGANLDEVDVFRVPGSWEMPVVAGELARAKKHDAIICVGAVVKGETPHFDYVAGNAAGGLARIAADTGVPVAFGVLTTNSFDQAVDRAGGKGGNKGYDAACTAIEMAHLLRGIRWAK